VNKFHAFYGTRKFIIVFAKTRHWSLSWARWLQSTTSPPISLRSILIVPSHLHLDLRAGLFTSGFRPKFVWIYHLSLMRTTCPAHLNNILWSIMSCLNVPLYCSFFDIITATHSGRSWIWKDVKVWIGFIWLGIGSSTDLLVIRFRVT